jgi:hypothetical protein
MIRCKDCGAFFFTAEGIEQHCCIGKDPGPDKPACHICGTKRQRNLIISYLKKKGESILWVLHGDPYQAFRDGKLDRNVICHRCSMLELSQDDLRYLKDRYFPAGDMRRYKDLRQKVLANAHKRNMGGD